MGKGINRFEEVTKKDIGQFLSTKQKPGTRNLYIFAIEFLLSPRNKLLKLAYETMLN